MTPVTPVRTAARPTVVTTTGCFRMELHRDAATFYAEAVEAEDAEEFDRRDRCARAAIVSSALEGQLKMAAAGHAEARRERLEPIVHDTLRQQERPWMSTAGLSRDLASRP